MHARFGGGKSKKYQQRQLAGFLSYKVHVTETCDEELPHLLIHVETTAATTQDKEVTEPIHQGLANIQLLPSQHLADTGYVDGPQLVTRKPEYGIELLGPVTVDPSWQANARQGFDAASFREHFANSIKK